MLRLYAAVFVVLTFVCSLFGQTQIRIADDSSSGTYAQMLGQLVDACSSDAFNIVPVNEGGGAVGNLAALYNNHADAAFLHSDVFLYNAQADPSYNRFKTLLALWPEQIHVLALRNSKTSKPGTFSYGKLQINSLSDLVGANFKAAAAGGGVLTSKLLSGQGRGGFQVIDAQKGDNVITMLRNGEVDAAIFVGAAPLPNLAKLSGQEFKLVPIGEAIAGNVGNVYRQATISGYSNGLTSGPLKTLAPIATLFSKAFSTQEKVKAQAALRNCATQKLGYLQDNGSPNWQDVTAGDHGISVIPYLELPSTSTAQSHK